jgi:hypothetical protein
MVISPSASGRRWGPDYSLHVLLTPTGLQEIRWKIENCVELVETRESKSKLSVALRYAHMLERELLDLPFAVSHWDISVVLSSKIPETELSFSPLQLTKRDEFTYALPSGSAARDNADEFWIVFPDPAKRSLEVAQIIVAILIAAFTSLLQIPIVKKRRLGWVLAIFVLSSSIVVLAAYYAFALAKGLEFVAWVGISIPHAVFGLGASVYVLLARSRQAIVVGRVQIDGEDAILCDVSVWEICGAKPRRVARTDQLSNGAYHFFVWLRRGDSRFEVVAQAKGTNEVKSSGFELSKGDKHDVPRIDLRRQPLVSSPTAQAGVP